MYRNMKGTKGWKGSSSDTILISAQSCRSMVAFFCNFHMVDYVMRTYSFFFKPLHKKAPFFTSFIAGRSTLLINIFCFPYERTKSNSISKLMWILDIQGRHSSLKSVDAEETFRDFPRLRDLEARNL